LCSFRSHIPATPLRGVRAFGLDAVHGWFVG
jgi:hypothetical protein